MRSLKNSSLLILLTLSMNIVGCRTRQKQSDLQGARDTISTECNGTGTCVVKCAPGHAHKGIDGVVRCLDRGVSAEFLENYGRSVCAEALPSPFTPEDGCQALNPTVANNGGNSGNGSQGGGVQINNVPSCFKTYPELTGVLFSVEIPFIDSPADPNYADLCNQTANQLARAFRLAAPLGKFFNTNIIKPVIYLVSKDKQQGITYEKGRRWLKIPIAQNVTINQTTIMKALTASEPEKTMINANWAWNVVNSMNRQDILLSVDINKHLSDAYSEFTGEFGPDLIALFPKTIAIKVASPCELENNTDYFYVSGGGSDIFTFTGNNACAAPLNPFPLPPDGKLAFSMRTDGSDIKSPVIKLEKITVTF
jgi:hypothetical protein